MARQITIAYPIIQQITNKVHKYWGVERMLIKKRTDIRNFYFPNFVVIPLAKNLYLD